MPCTGQTVFLSVSVSFRMVSFSGTIHTKCKYCPCLSLTSPVSVCCVGVMYQSCKCHVQVSLSFSVCLSIRIMPLSGPIPTKYLSAVKMLCLCLVSQSVFISVCLIGQCLYLEQFTLHIGNTLVYLFNNLSSSLFFISMLTTFLQLNVKLMFNFNQAHFPSSSFSP